MYVTGIGRTKFGTLTESMPELIYQAMYNAINDSPIPIEEIGAVYVSNFIGGPSEKQLHLNSVVSSLLPELRLPIIRVETACASGSSALYQGIIALSRFENILIVGVEKMTGSTSAESSQNLGMAGDRTADQMQGLIFPAHYALVAQQHMKKYGTTHEDLELVAFKNHNNSRLNPLAHFNHKDVTLEMIKNAPVIASPLNLFDCSPISDGAAAVVISKNSNSDRDVKVTGSALATDHISLSHRKEHTSLEAAKVASTQAYELAGITPKDLDIVEVHDCFTINELVAMEDLGICNPGESKNWIREGRTSIKGDVPINTDGGLKADGHPIGATGLAQVFEVTTQLRGEAGERQVDGAEIGLTHNIGGVGGTAVVHILERRG
ncbi:acetyl-CoA acetyltransferase [Candidatus Scalindua japonica]|uniref:Acetyl-CoA acetyltransferase n=1 Tax=Candidatus Scalindua japonica TaxID=1284222 RepID=A0A286TU61_9BACT|nr:thiolase domain-containing protein [Candidatus Scalindua japonica]GAX59427.1 acetyl-CoA acetyltransferase [Candidatus Scalindua japonica]